MTDVVGSVAFDVIAEFNDADFTENIAKGLGRTRDEFGRFVKEHRSITQNMMKDMSSIMNSGTSSAMSVVTKNMASAADAAGKGFTSRIGAALKSVPKSIGQALATGAISTVGAAGTKLGQHVSDAVADQIHKSAPFWKKSFTESFKQAADVNTTESLNKLAIKIKGGGDNAGLSFQDALGKRFSEAGIVASSKLGNFAAQVANKIIPGSSNAGEEGVSALVKPFTERLPTALKVGLGVAAGAGVLALISRLRKGGKDAVDATGQDMQSGAASIGQRTASGIVSGFTAPIKALGSVASSALSSAGSALVSAGAAVGRKTAEAMGDALKLGANVAGGAIAGILGVSLTKGFNRLKAIDNAEASLRGLASTANHVPEIMDAVNVAMTGTAFGMDQGAKAAAQFAAAGVPLSDMERHLGALANTAAAAGGDFDGVAGIFSKVAAGGKVTGEVLNQLTDRGLAALPALADQLGVTADEVRSMVSAGEVSFDDFSKAMDKAMGNVAIEQATTFTGLMGNVSAAMGRLGAVVQKPIFDSLKAVMPGVMNLFNQFKAVIEPLAEIIADRLVPYATSLGKAMEGLKFNETNASASQLFGTLAALAPVLGGVAAAFAGPLLTSIPIIGPMLSGLSGPVGILAGALVALFAVKPETLMAGFQSITNALPVMLDKLIEKVGEVMPGMAANFASNATILIQGFLKVINQLVSAVATLAPMVIPVVVEAITQLASAVLIAAPQLLNAGIVLISGLVDGVMDALPVLIDAVPKMVESFVSSFSAHLPFIIEAGVGLVLSLIDGLVSAIPAIISAVPTIVNSILNGIVKSLPKIIEGGIKLVSGLIDGIVTAIPAIVSAVVDAIPLLVDGIVGAIPDLLSAGMALIDGLVTGIVDGLPLIIDAVIDAIPLLITALTNALPKLISGGIELVLGLVKGVIKAIPKIITAVVGAIPQIIEGLVDALPQLITGGIDLVLGLIGGIIEAIPQLIAAVIGAIPQIIGALLGALPQLISGGISLIMGLIQGIWEATPQIIQAVIDIVPQLLTGLGKAFPQLTQFFVDAWNNITATIKSVWEGVKKFFSDTWTNITTGAKTQWNNFMTWISSFFMAQIQVVKNIWNGLVSFFTGLWDGIKAATQYQWKVITDWLASVFNGAVSTAKGIWNGIKSFFSGLWDGVKKTFNTFLTFVKTKPTEAFQKAVDSIGRVWEGIKNLAKKPVRFVIDTVINGLIGTINKLPGVNISKVALPAGFARGGVLPGYQAAKRDDQLVPMRSGEGVLVPEVVRGLGANTIHALNAVGNTGGVSAVRNRFGGLATHPGRALGGLITPLAKDTWTVSQPYHGGHNGLDMAAAMGTPILAAADGIVQMAQAVNMGGNEIYLAHKRLATRYSHLSQFKVAAGQMVKQGQVIGNVGTTGMSTGPHLHYMVHNPNDGGNGFGYQNHVNPMPYIGAYGQAFDGFDIIGGLIDWATSKFKGAFPEGGMWVDAAGGILKSGVNQLTDWGKSLLGSDDNDKGHTSHPRIGSAKLYDRGGWMNHGDVGVNLSGKPEAVFTNEESMALKSLLSNGGRSVVIESGAIVIQGVLDPERASIAVLDRIAEELEG